GEASSEQRAACGRQEEDNRRRRQCVAAGKISLLTLRHRLVIRAIAASAAPRRSSSRGESAGTCPIGITPVVVVDVLFAGLGSGDAELTVAVFERVVAFAAA